MADDAPRLPRAFLHFHSYPVLSRASQEKVRELATAARRSISTTRACCSCRSPTSQQQVILTVPPPLRVVIYRRLMMRIAEEVARRHRALALVTGEVVGQVASQTLENLNRINEVVDAAGAAAADRDGQGRDHRGRRSGSATYPISIIPDQDCCTLFTPRHPATKARRGDVERAEASLPIDEMIEKALAAAVVEEFQFPVVK